MLYAKNYDEQIWMNVHASIDLTIQPTTIQGQWKILLLTCGFFKERCECYDCCFPFGTLPDCRAVLRHNINRMGFLRQRMRSMNSNTSRCYATVELHMCFSIQTWWQNNQFEAAMKGPILDPSYDVTIHYLTVPQFGLRFGLFFFLLRLINAKGDVDSVNKATKIQVIMPGLC